MNKLESIISRVILFYPIAWKGDIEWDICPQILGNSQRRRFNRTIQHQTPYQLEGRSMIASCNDTRASVVRHNML